MAVLSIGVMLSCKDGAVLPTLDPEFGAYAKGQWIAPSGALLPLDFDPYSQNAVNLLVFWDKANTNETTSTTSVKGQVTWNAGKESIVINKIELYAQFIESYSDKDNNVVTRSHGPAASPTVPEGKLMATIDAAARVTPAQFTVKPADVYNLYKGTTFDYKGTGAVDIFQNNPGGSRTTNRFLASRVDPVSGKTLGADNISIRWRLLAADGRAFGSFHLNVCTQLTDANCNVLFIVK